MLTVLCNSMLCNSMLLGMRLNYFDSYVLSIIYITDMLPQHPVNIMELFC